MKKLIAMTCGLCLGCLLFGILNAWAQEAPENEPTMKEQLEAADDITEKTLELTDNKGASVVYDPVGGRAGRAAFKATAFEGRFVVIGYASGEWPKIELPETLPKNISLVGLHWGLYFERDPEALQDAKRALVELYTDGKINPLVSAKYPLVEAAAALEALGNRNTTGKVVLIP